MKLSSAFMVMCLAFVGLLPAASALNMQNNNKVPLRVAIAQACKPGGSKTCPAQSPAIKQPHDGMVVCAGFAQAVQQPAHLAQPAQTKSTMAAVANAKVKAAAVSPEQIQLAFEMFNKKAADPDNPKNKIVGVPPEVVLAAKQALPKKGPLKPWSMSLSIEHNDGIKNAATNRILTNPIPIFVNQHFTQALGPIITQQVKSQLQILTEWYRQGEWDAQDQDGKRFKSRDFQAAEQMVHKKVTEIADLLERNNAIFYKPKALWIQEKTQKICSLS